MADNDIVPTYADEDSWDGVGAVLQGVQERLKELGGNTSVDLSLLIFIIQTSSTNLNLMIYIKIKN